MNCCDSQPRGRKSLLDAIGAVSFAADELRLYLDTHPDSQEALSLFTAYTEQRRDLIARYTEAFGPIDSYDFNDNGSWTWNQDPMPWKAEAN